MGAAGDHQHRRVTSADFYEVILELQRMTLDPQLTGNVGLYYT